MNRQPTFKSIFTASVGFNSAGHSLPSKLKSISQAGFNSVEIFQDDLDEFSKSEEFQKIYKTLTPPSSPHYGSKGGIGLPSCDEEVEDLGVGSSNSTSSSSSSPSTSTQQEEEKTSWNAHGPCTPFESQREIVCASYIRGICESLGLSILSLQPMRDVEGWKSSEKRKASIERVRSRFPVLRALGTDLLLCCSNCQPASEITDDVNECAKDFELLAEEAATYNVGGGNNDLTNQQKPLRIAFEALSWGTYVGRWDQAYTIVEKVNKSNFGICFDSFNTLGRQFADPCSATGIQEPRKETEKALQQSLQSIAQRVSKEKVFFLQVGDARKLKTPLEPSPNPTEERPSRMIWSRGNRLYPGEFDKGAFMPTLDFVNAVLKTGYHGPWSIEVFNSSLLEPGVEVQKEHAKRGFQGLNWLIENVEQA